MENKKDMLVQIRDLEKALMSAGTKEDILDYHKMMVSELCHIRSFLDKISLVRDMTLDNYEYKKILQTCPDDRFRYLRMFCNEELTSLGYYIRNAYTYIRDMLPDDEDDDEDNTSNYLETIKEDTFYDLVGRMLNVTYMLELGAEKIDDLFTLADDVIKARNLDNYPEINKMFSGPENKSQALCDNIAMIRDICSTFSESVSRLNLSVGDDIYGE